MNETILVAVIGAFAGLLPIAATTGITWLEKRGRQNTLRDSLDIAHKRLDFLSAYFQLQQSLMDSEHLEEVKTSVASESKSLRHDLLRLTAPDRDEPPLLHERPLLQRVFLAYRPRRVGGWIYRLIFYMIIGILVAVVLDGIRTGKMFTGIDDSGQFSLAYLIGEFIGIFLFIGGFLIPPWFLANRGERKAEASRQRSVTSTHQAHAADPA